MIDTHAHIHGEQYDADRVDVLARAKSAGVEHIITVGCDLADSQKALEIARELRVFCSIGVHPHEAKTAPPDMSAVFEAFLRDSRVIAIGETGLDYYYDHSPRETQQDVLRAQIRIARTHGFPVIFHHRDAYDDFTAILREEWEEGMRGVIHCFTGDVHQARTYVDEFGLYLGIGGVLTFKTAAQIREAVVAVGLGSLVLETDCPYLAPIPHRGQRNEPAYVAFTRDKLAEVLGADAASVEAATDENARALFHL